MDFLRNFAGSLLAEVYVGSTKAVITILLILILALFFEVFRLRRSFRQIIKSNREDNEVNRQMVEKIFNELKEFAEKIVKDYSNQIETSNKSNQKIKEVLGNLIVVLTANKDNTANSKDNTTDKEND